MSMALPVILNNTPYNTQEITKYEFGESVQPENIDEIASVLRSLLENKNKRKTYGINGRKLISEKYCWDIEQNKLLRLYDELLETKKVEHGEKV